LVTALGIVQNGSISKFNIGDFHLAIPNHPDWTDNSLISSNWSDQPGARLQGLYYYSARQGESCRLFLVTLAQFDPGVKKIFVVRFSPVAGAIKCPCNQTMSCFANMLKPNPKKPLPNS
jgi:hypothetical protein